MRSTRAEDLHISGELILVLLKRHHRFFEYAINLGHGRGGNHAHLQTKPLPASGYEGSSKGARYFRMHDNVRTRRRGYPHELRTYISFAYDRIKSVSSPVEEYGKGVDEEVCSESFMSVLECADDSIEVNE